MSSQVYECLFIFDSNRYSRDPGGVSESVKEAIESHGGEILVTRLWASDHKLAYPVDGHYKGTYWLTYFRLESTKLKELNRTYQLNDSVVRFMFTRIDPRIVEAVVAHAQGRQLNGGPDEVRIPVGAAVTVEIDGEDEEDLE